MGVSNQENYPRGFLLKGQPPIIKYETKRDRLNMLCAINNMGATRFMIVEGPMTQQGFIEFMGRLIHDVPRKVFFIVGSLRVQHGKLVKAWLDKHNDRIELFLLPF